MSFELELRVPGLTWQQADAVGRACDGKGRWPVQTGPRKRWGRPRPPALWMPEAVGGHHLLTDEAEWDAPAWDMDPQLLPLLAATIDVLADALPQGFAFRATWTGSEVRAERDLSAAQLRDVILSSSLNGFTRYVVRQADC